MLSPLAYLPAGWMLISARAANAVFGFATIVLLVRALRNRASPGASLVALSALLCTDAFLLASSLARNDALAMAFLAAALPPLLSATDTRSARMLAFGGLAFGLAISTKISAALPAAGAGLFLVFRIPHYRAKSLLAFGGGLFVGLLPTFLLAAIAPGQFRFDVFDYNLEAPVQWLTSISEAAELNPLRHALKLVGIASVGSVLVALAATAIDRSRTDVRRMLDLMIVGGLVAAFLPVPALVQYLVPSAALFVRFALALDAAPPRARKALIVLAAVGSVAGLTSSFVVRFAGLELFRSVAYGRQVAALARGGRVVTLSAEYVAGSGVSLDSRFAAGPFLYRTHGQLGQRAQAAGRAVTAESVSAALTSSPPAVIVVGAEGRPFRPLFPNGLDQPLVDWAGRHGYRPTQLGHGLVAYVAPARSSSGAVACWSMFGAD